jgi:hypothetical protein
MHARSIRNLAERVQLYGTMEEARWLLKAAAKIDGCIPRTITEVRDDSAGQSATEPDRGAGSRDAGSRDNGSWRRGQVIAFASHGSPGAARPGKVRPMGGVAPECS